MKSSKNKVSQASDYSIDESKRSDENKQKKEEEAKRKLEEYREVHERAQKQRDQAEEGNNFINLKIIIFSFKKISKKERKFTIQLLHCFRSCRSSLLIRRCYAFPKPTSAFEQNRSH